MTNESKETSHSYKEPLCEILYTNRLLGFEADF